MTSQKRSISKIANDIRKDWKNVNFAAKPYLGVMLRLDKITYPYIHEGGARSIVEGFLCNCGTWRGEIARQIKTELKEML